MTERWWAPTRATLEPDEVVKALLVPGTDAGSDLGSYVLAAHRAGAAAAETVAKGAVPSENGLVQAMATARGHFAPVMVDAISTHLPASYAGLLTRDLLDEAEQGALQLYRSAVSKGVAPPIAAQRAGAVYGVPFRQMGTYVPLATDPRANPVAVTDSADRVVLKYAEHISKTETSSVSKADDFDERQHPRHADGRFRVKGGATAVREREQTAPTRQPLSTAGRLRSILGLGGQAAPRVDTAPKDRIAQEPKTERPPAREQRKMRRMHRQKQKAEVAELTANPLQMSPMKVRQLQSTAMSTAALKLNLSPAKLSPAKPKAKAKSEAKPLAGPMTPLDNSPAVETVIDADLTMHADSRHWNVLSAEVSQQASEFADPSSRIFRIGHLMKATGSPEQVMTPYSQNALQGVEEAVLDRYGDEYVQPRTSMIYAEEINDLLHGAGATDAIFGPHDPVARVAELLHYRQLALTGKERIEEDGSSRLVPDPTEAPHTVALPIYHQHGTDNYDVEGERVGPEYAVVNFQPAADNSRRRVRPMVDEFIVQGAMGTEEYGGEGKKSRSNYELDRNAVYEVYEPQGISDQFGWVSEARHMAMYDHERDVVVRRWFLRPISEDEADEIIGGPGNVDKALVGAELARFNQMVNRDSDGKFASSASRSSSPVTAHRAGTALLERPTVVTESDQVQPGLVTRPAQPVRQKREARQMRRMRRARPIRRAPEQESAALTRSPMNTQDMTLSPLKIRPLTMGQLMGQVLTQKQKKPGRKSVPIFSDFNDYKLMTHEDLAKLSIAEDRPISLLKDGEFQDIQFSITRKAMAEAESTKSVHLPAQMAAYVQDAQDRSGMSTKMVGTFKLASSDPEVSAEDRFDLAVRVSDLFDENPNMEMVEIVRHGNRLNIFSTPMVSKHQVVVEIDPDVNLAESKNLEIGKLGTYRANDVMVDITDGPPTTLVDVKGKLQVESHDVEGLLANPKIDLFRITNAKIDRYRIQPN